MVWLFALGIIALMVYSKGFRKFVGICAGVCVVLGLIGYVYNEYDRAQTRAQEAAQTARWNAEPVCKGKNEDEKAQAYLESSAACRPF